VGLWDFNRTVYEQMMTALYPLPARAYGTR